MGVAGDNERVTPGIFVTGGAQGRQETAPDRRRVCEGFRRNRRERRRCDPNVGEHEASAERSSWQQQMPRLETEECDAGAGLNRGATLLARRAVKAGRQIDRQDRTASALTTCVDPLDKGSRLAGEIAIEP